MAEDVPPCADVVRSRREERACDWPFRSGSFERLPERFRILAVTGLGEAECALLGATRAASLEEAVRRAWVPGRSAVARWGARYLLA